MSVPVLAFQIININDDSVKNLFKEIKQNDHLYVSKFDIALSANSSNDDENDKDVNKLNEKFSVTSSNTETEKLFLKHFPFNSLLNHELELITIDLNGNILLKTVLLHNIEYNYLLILYLDSSESCSRFNATCNLPERQFKSLKSFIHDSTTKLNEKIIKESLGKKELSRKTKIFPNSATLKNLVDHVTVIEEDPALNERYLEIFQNFDTQFIKPNFDDTVNFSSSTTQNSFI